MPSELRSRLPILALLTALLLILQLSPNAFSVEARIQSIRTAAESGRISDARDELETLIGQNAELSGLHHTAAQLALQEGEFKVAREHLDHSFPPSEYDCLEASLQIVESSQPDLERLKTLELKNCPYVIEPLQLLAAAHLQSSDPTSALPILEILVEMSEAEDSDYKQYLYLLTLVNPYRAKETLEELSASDQIEWTYPVEIQDYLDNLAEPNSPESLFTLGRIFALHDEWHLARYAFEEALKDSPQDPILRAYFGLALDRTGGDGLSELEQAKRESPDSATIRTLLGMHWSMQAAHQEAIQELSLATQLEPENPWIRVQLANAYLGGGDVSRAEDSYRAAATLSPENTEIWIQAAEFSTLNEVNVSSMGIPAARNAFTSGKGDPRAVSLLGYAYALTGDMMIAERLAHLAISLDADDPMIQYHLGVLRSIQGDSGGAIAAFLRTKDLDPEGTYGRLAEIQLRE